jgi:hypothetical protein
VKKFIIQRRLDGKWNLKSDLDFQWGIFDSRATAEDAIKLILNPIAYFYDENGDEIKKETKHER